MRPPSVQSDSAPRVARSETLPLESCHAESGPGPGCWENWDDPHLIVTFITLHLHSSNSRPFRESVSVSLCIQFLNIMRFRERPVMIELWGVTAMVVWVPQLIHNIPSTSPIQPWLGPDDPSVDMRESGAERMIGKTQFRLHRQLSKIVP